MLFEVNNIIKFLEFSLISLAAGEILSIIIKQKKGKIINRSDYYD